MENGETKVKTVTVRQTQKNGDIYVLERRTVYDPEKKYNRVVSTRLVSKIPKGTDTPVPTRPKRKRGETPLPQPTAAAATRSRVGMMDIVGHVGAESGIDEAVRASTDPGTAQKIVSLARYLLATNGQSLPGILTWQLNHPLPYGEAITEDVYHNLFVQVGLDESLQQTFFLRRCERLPATEAVAYDSTTMSVYSENQEEARFGFNKAHDGLRTVKVLTLYSVESRQPIAFTKQPGNLPDVVSVGNALKQLSVLGLTAAELVTDNGYYSEANLSELLRCGFKFITLAKTGLKWIRSEIDARMEALGDFGTLCPFDTAIHGVTVPVMHEFSRTRKYASRKEGGEKGTEETFTRRVYVHIYFNMSRQNADRAALESDLLELKARLESGTDVADLSEEAQEKVHRFFVLKGRGKSLTVAANNKAIRDANRYHGYFVLLSNGERDTFECLRKYRRRETIESFFEAGKQKADGTRPRVWHADTLRGRMFVQFVALCYYEHFAEKIRKLKEELGKDIEGGGLTAAELRTTRKLQAWVKNTPLYLQLQWFDAVEQVCVSNGLARRRWSTEVTACDALYLKKLGVIKRFS